MGTAALGALGVSATRASVWARAGWLEHLGRGAYLLAGDTLSREGALAHLCARLPGLHVGGRTALAWRGTRQYLAFRETLELWGDRSGPLPAWFTGRFAARYQATRLFDDRLPAGFGVQPLPDGDPRVMVSVPERAVLELLSDLGKTLPLAGARDTLDGIQGLRRDVLGTLLAHTTRVKVARAAALFAIELGLPWADLAIAHSERVGGGRRWVAVGRNGERITLKRVPVTRRRDGKAGDA